MRILSLYHNFTITGVGLVSLSGGENAAVRMQANPMPCLHMVNVRGRYVLRLVQRNVNAPKGSFDGPSVCLYN